MLLAEISQITTVVLAFVKHGQNISFQNYPIWPGMHSVFHLSQWCSLRLSSCLAASHSSSFTPTFMNNAQEHCIAETRLSLLLPVMKNFNATAYKHISCNSMCPTFCLGKVWGRTTYTSDGLVSSIFCRYSVAQGVLYKVYLLQKH